MKHSLLFPCMVLVFGLFGCGKTIDESKAKDIASIKLQEYCEEGNLHPSDFKLKELSPSGDVPWAFEYETISTSPRHTVLIYIDRGGYRTTHDMIEPEDWYDRHPRPEK